MIDNKEVINSYNDLYINDKKNEFSILLQKIDSLLSELLKNKNLPANVVVKNYNVNSDNNLTEEEMLTFFYEDLWNIKNKLLLLMTYNMAMKGGNH